MMFRRILVGLATGVGLVACMSAPAGAATLPPTLKGEKLAQHKVWDLSSAPACLFDGYQLSEASTFCTSGTATGPYPGTFQESGTYNTVSTDPLSNPDQDYGKLTVYQVTFTIDSPVGLVTGTEKLNPKKNGTYVWNAGIGGFDETVSAPTDYAARITLPDGGVYGDAGTTAASLDQSQSGVANTSTIGISDPFTSPASAVTVITPPPPPSPITAPGIVGSFVQGQTLYETPGTWSGAPLSYMYQWDRCDASGAIASCSPVTGETAMGSYTLGSVDVGMTLRVLEFAANGAGSGGPNISGPTPVIQALPSPPAAAVPPTGTTPPISTAPITPIQLALPAKLGIAGVLRHGGFAWTLTAPQRGRLVVTWSRAGSLIGVGSRHFTRSGLVTVKIHLTRAGRRLLRTHRSLRLLAKATFTPAGGTPVSVTRVLRLTS